MFEIGKYRKEVIRREPGKTEISLIDWQPGSRSPAHDHTVNEVTYVLEGRIFEIVDGVKTYYECGSRVEVRVGTVHEVGVDKTDGPARTLNICDGLLDMNLHPQSNIE